MSNPSGAKFHHSVFLMLRRDTDYRDYYVPVMKMSGPREKVLLLAMPIAALGFCLSRCSVVERIIQFLDAPPVSLY